MSLLRLDNISLVLEDLDPAIAFFQVLGLELEGRTTVEGPWVDKVVGLQNVRSEIAMLRTPDGHNRLELVQFHRPAAVGAEHRRAPTNALGLRRLMFAVTDLDATLARLIEHGAELVDEVAQFENLYRLCFLRGPEGVLLALAEKLSDDPLPLSKPAS